MLSIIIPTLNAQAELPATLESLMPALIDGMIAELIIVDGGSIDKTIEIADTAGAAIITAEKPSRGAQLALAAQSAKSNWMLFLHADTELEQDWHQEVRTFISEQNEGSETTASFSFAIKDKGLRPSLLTKAVALRCKFFNLPYGDQALLISKQTYENSGGYKPIPVMEDVDLIRRLTPRPAILKSRAFTSAKRYQAQGYLKRSLKNLTCLAAYYRGVDPEKIKDSYEKS